MAHKMREAVQKARADPDYVRKARDAPLNDSRSRTMLILGELLRGFILDSNSPMSENDAVDLIHAAMPLNCCDYVLLDGPWAERVEKMKLRLGKSPIVMPIAKCFSRRNDGINAFLTDLEHSAPLAAIPFAAAGIGRDAHSRRAIWAIPQPKCGWTKAVTSTDTLKMAARIHRTGSKCSESTIAPAMMPNRERSTVGITSEAPKVQV
jgi:hypothetical protein